MNYEIIRALTGNSIVELRTEAFILENEVVCGSINTYMRMLSDDWICLSISEGEVMLKYIPEPVLTTDFTNNDFDYRILKYDWRITAPIEKLSLIVSKESENHYFGLLFSFKDGQSISFLDDDDCILIGPIEPWLWNCSIKHIKSSY